MDKEKQLEEIEKINRFIYYLEWCPSQQQWHIDTLEKIILSNQNIFSEEIRGNFEGKDFEYIIVDGPFLNLDDAYAAQEKWINNILIKINKKKKGGSNV